MRAQNQNLDQRTGDTSDGDAHDERADVRQHDGSLWVCAVGPPGISRHVLPP